MANGGSSLKPVTFDGWLIALLVMMPAAVAWISGDEAAKYVPAIAIFYLKGWLSIVSVGLGALKAYRSMLFAEYKQNGKPNGNGNGHTETLTKADASNPTG